MTALDLAIDETGAQVQVESLSIMPGDALPLGQLFQNLLSHALKFSRPGDAPQIAGRGRPADVNELPMNIRVTRRSDMYYRVEVVDNGIGFEEKYLDRIFQVFQPLHARHGYAGTGFGLAICQKVVINHGGAITASSHPGQGETLSDYLPAE